MAAVDFLQLALEESPLNELTYDDAASPSRISTVLVYPPSRTAKIAPGPQPMSRADELRGIAGEVPRLADSYEPAGSITTRAYGDLLPLLLSLCGFTGAHVVGNGVITDPDGATIPTGAHRWVFTKQAGIVAQTARIRTNYADENVLLEGYGFACSQLGIAADASLSADLVGLFMRRLAADTATVPVISAATVQPFRRGDLYVSALAGGGPLSDFTVNIANTLERIHSSSLATPSDWGDLLEFGDDQVAVSGTIPKRILTGTDLDALIAATTFAMTARWTGRSVVTGTRKYGLWIEMPKCQYVGGDQDELQNRRRHGFSPDWFAAWDEGLGYDAKITVVCGVSAIATYV